MLFRSERVTVSKKDGSTSTVTVDRVFFRGQDGICLASIVASGQQSSRNGGQRSNAKTGSCAQCGRACKPQYKLCWDCKCGQAEDNGDFDFGANRRTRGGSWGRDMTEEQRAQACEDADALLTEERAHGRD